ncbi:hypothetical protein [Neptunitalea lumnitzerae]|uniref:WG repeat-containing protein n=1 Tax=Neptunitalea lumnitzerae TaxID=2965509 RepID=A0ABQ5MLX3_9FLAO|nr:hypothetical protein [Neptunitalea sp. Y10]GLB50408.1 hypothetical protein Y10_27760 [Neptunitalea sp. Y10]
MKIVTLIFTVLLAVNSYAQDQLTDKEICKLLKAKKIIWDTDPYDEYDTSAAQIQLRTNKKWGLFNINRAKDELWTEDYFRADTLAPAIFDSIGWFSEYNFKYTIVKKDDAYDIFLYPIEVHNALEKLTFPFEAIKTIRIPEEEEDPFELRPLPFLVVKEKGKWGLIDWFDKIYIVPPIYNTYQEVPLTVMNSYELEELEATRQILNADLIEHDNQNGDGALIARNKDTKKWGMYQVFVYSESYRTLIPAAYDKIDFFDWNGSFTGVFKNGKVGIYLSSWQYDEAAKETVPCIYDNYAKVTITDTQTGRQQLYLAMQKQGKWGWVDWLTGEEKSAFTYASQSEMPTPTYVQKYFIE